MNRGFRLPTDILLAVLINLKKDFVQSLNEWGSRSTINTGVYVVDKVLMKAVWSNSKDRYFSEHSYEIWQIC